VCREVRVRSGARQGAAKAEGSKAMNVSARRIVRFAAIAINLVAFLLEMNLEIQPRLHPQLHVDWTWWSRIEELAPLLALVALMWPGVRRKS
jgi:hypothetical protein